MLFAAAPCAALLWAALLCAALPCAALFCAELFWAGLFWAGPLRLVLPGSGSCPLVCLGSEAAGPVGRPCAALSRCAALRCASWSNSGGESAAVEALLSRRTADSRSRAAARSRSRASRISRRRRREPASGVCSSLTQIPHRTYRRQVQVQVSARPIHSFRQCNAFVIFRRTSASPASSVEPPVHLLLPSARWHHRRHAPAQDPVPTGR